MINWRKLAEKIGISGVTNAGYQFRVKYEEFIVPFEAILLRRFDVLFQQSERNITHDYHNSYLLIFIVSVSLVIKYIEIHNYSSTFFITSVVLLIYAMNVFYSRRIYLLVMKY